MTTPQLTDWIEGNPLHSRPGWYDVAQEIEATAESPALFIELSDRQWWGGRQWMNGAAPMPEWAVYWNHFRGLTEKV